MDILQEENLDCNILVRAYHVSDELRGGGRLCPPPLESPKGNFFDQGKQV